MHQILYDSVIKSLMYAQVGTHMNIAHITEILGRYLSNPSMNHWKVTKKVLRYL
jgi:hypothetical protein